jgi:hypothetical protein
MIRGPDASANYLRDLGHLLKEDALEAKRDAEAASGEDAAFARGLSLAYYEVISLMQQQAWVFGIPLEEMSLADINPDKDLI